MSLSQWSVTQYFKLDIPTNLQTERKHEKYSHKFGMLCVFLDSKILDS